MGKYFVGEMKYKNKKIIICKQFLYIDLLCDMYIIFYIVFILYFECVLKNYFGIGIIILQCFVMFRQFKLFFFVSKIWILLFIY